MRPTRRRIGVLIATIIGVSALTAQRYGPGRAWWDAGQGGYLPWDDSCENPDGQVTVVSKKGSVQTQDHPFFEPLGSNRRACITCHQPANAMSVSTANLRQRWI